MGLFDLFTGGSPDLAGQEEDAFRREQARLKIQRRELRKETAFLLEEGKGVSERAEFSFGDELDLENLTEEERLQRSTGRIDTGLIL